MKLNVPEEDYPNLQSSASHLDDSIAAAGYSYVTLVNLCALVNGGQRFLFFVRVLDGW